MIKKRLPAFIALLSLAIVAPVVAQADKPLLHENALPIVAAPNFAGPLAPPFVGVKGKWVPDNGVLNIVNIPEEKHIPVLHHKVGLGSAVVEVEFRLDGPGSFLVGCDSDRHVGRVVINAAGLSIAEDSVNPSHTIAKLPLAVKQGEWHQLRVEWKGDRMAARLDGKELRAQHAFLGTPKSRSWLAASETVKVRKLRISGEKTAARE
ncbi:MAG: hypothetical protein ABMA01_21270 [Chthoniobacteraceae bacterium]